MKALGFKLPMLISVPHGGMTVPEDLQGKCLIDVNGILMDSDTCARELYDFKDLVEEYVDTDIARLVVDMNRSQNDLPPSNPDGVVKTISVTGQQVWNQPSGLSQQDIRHLLQQYHTPYHQRLRKSTKNKKVVLGIDCHTMLAKENRPLFCIGNRGSETGYPLKEPITAPTDLLLKLQENIYKEFESIVPKDTQLPFVTLNTPFAGGYITHFHGNAGDIPWLQLEINRSLYLPDVEKISIIPDQFVRARLKEIRDKLYNALQSLVDLC